MISIKDVNLDFGGISVLTSVSMEVHPGSIYALIGPNGAGKTSLINCITGFYLPNKGSIRLGEIELIGLKPDTVSKLGITRMFQNIELFPHLSVLNNILVGRHLHVRYSPLEAAFRFGRMLKEEVRHYKAAEVIVEFLDLEMVRHKPVASLPYGIQKKVELGRALATEGRTMLLDEPFGGLSIEEKQDMARYILEIQSKFEATILLVDHDIQVVSDIAEQIIVLDYGHKLAEGVPNKVLSDPTVLEAYLGNANSKIQSNQEITPYD